MRRFTVVVATAAVAVGAFLGVAGSAGAAGNKAAALSPADKKVAIAAFKKAGCAGCHTLAAAGAIGTRGPNLDGLFYPVSDIIRQITNGGSYMPAFKGILTPTQIKLVAAWVDQVRQIKDPSAPAATTAKPAATTVPKPGTITPAQKAVGVAAFKKAGCGGCHTLAAQGAIGTRGPNLDGLYFPVADMIRQVTNGGSYMPAFKGILTPAQIKAVVAYIDAVRQIKAG